MYDDETYSWLKVFIDMTSLYFARANKHDEADQFTEFEQPFAAAGHDRTTKGEVTHQLFLFHQEEQQSPSELITEVLYMLGFD
jgi:hypothetical protein